MSASAIALITGASRGIGAATARLFARQGYALGLNYLQDHAAAAALASELRAIGCRCILLQADIGNEAQVLAMFQRLDAELGPLSVLVNNAAILKPQSPIRGINATRFAAILQTNVIGTFLCCQQAVLRMSTDSGGRGGVIVNVSSGAAKSGSPNEYIDYAASKGAVDTLTRGLALEVAAQGIRVNAVRPGFIYTDMHATGGEPGRVDRLKSRIPLGRGGEASEVAQAIAWLASDAASFTTGSFIDVCGGV
ncbi:SDR family oxidoreductase [Rheinheimera texasensis]|uniref:SDR family oxidoreductase n=1 Tax=Rheinheimera texasensis TaxID=306205 RepID=UPI0004E1A2C8|nr:SDR family oxidoreductase [Rheinheimera texasensis]